MRPGPSARRGCGNRPWVAAVLAALVVAAGAASPVTSTSPALAAAAAASPETPAPLSVRVFTIKFREPGDVALLVGPLLTDRGSVMMQPKLKTITVQDTPATLERVAALVASYDVPPRSVSFTVTLILASRTEQGKQPISREVRGITDALSDIGKWTDYRTLGSTTVVGSEGSRSTLDIADYRIEFELESVSDSRGVIRLNPFTLHKASRAEGGSVTYSPVYKQTVNLRNDRLLTIGATKGGESNPRALFLAIRGRIEGP